MKKTIEHRARQITPQPASDQPTRALLRYFGGKWAIAPWVIAHLPKHRIYVEPFGGAASILLRKPRSRIEVYNDLDEEIVGIFRTVQDPKGCQALMRRLRRTPYSRRVFETAFQASSDPIIRAQRAIVRAYQSFHHESLFSQEDDLCRRPAPRQQPLQSPRMGNLSQKPCRHIPPSARRHHRMPRGHRCHPRTGHARHAFLRRPALRPIHPLHFSILRTSTNVQRVS